MQRHNLNFMEFLQGFRRGELLRQGDEQLARIIEAMSETGGNGELTIKLPFKFNKGGQIECTPQISAKVPQRAMGTGIFFASDEGRLTRRDPNQMDIEDEIERRKAAE
jgi:hypothetical protein